MGVHSLMFEDNTDFRTMVLAGFCPSGAGQPIPPPINGVPRTAFDTRVGGTCGRQDFLNMENVVNGGTKTYTVPITPTQLGVNVTLAWSDVPGSLGSNGPAIVNNLDLKVQASNGKTYLPSDPATGTRRTITRDTTEKVVILRSELVGVTSLTVTVTGTSVSQGPQPFALIAGGAIAAPITTTTRPPIPEDPPGQVVIDEIEQPIEGSVANSAAKAGAVFAPKNPVTFGVIVAANVLVLLLALIVLIVLKVIDNWCCFATLFAALA